MMTRKKYVKRMKQHERSFDLLWRKIVDETNEFIKDNPKYRMSSFQNDIENFVCYLALSAAWISDRINHKEYRARGSLTKKIRKALGYLIP